MPLILPPVPDRYDPEVETERNRVLVAADRMARHRGVDLDLNRDRLILTAPNGSRWQVVVGNTGTLSTVAL